MIRARQGWAVTKTTQRAQAIDATSQHTKQRRQQGHSAKHGNPDGDGSGIPQGAEDRHPGDEQGKQGDDYRAAGKDDGAARACHRARKRLLGRHARVQLIALAKDDKEGVVDAHPEADHGGHFGSVGGDVDEVAEQADQRQAGAEADQGGEDRQAGSHETAECVGQDNDGSDDADQFAGPRACLRERLADRAAGLDLQTGPTRRARAGQHPGGQVAVDLKAIDVHQHLGDRRGAVGAELVAPRRREGADHRRDVRQTADVAQRGGDRLPVGGATQAG